MQLENIHMSVIFPELLLISRSREANSLLHTVYPLFKLRDVFPLSESRECMAWALHNILCANILRNS